MLSRLSAPYHAEPFCGLQRLTTGVEKRQTGVAVVGIEVDELEERTGIDFFCNVPDWIENFVEKAYTLSDWNGM